MEQVKGRMRSLRLKRKREIKEEKAKEIWQKIRDKKVGEVRRNFSHLRDQEDASLGVSSLPNVLIHNRIEPIQWEKMCQGTLIQGQGLQRGIKTKYIRCRKKCELRFYDDVRDYELLFVSPLTIPLPQDSSV